MASPDTDELQTGAAGRPARGQSAAGGQQTEPLVAGGEPGAAGLEAAAPQQTEPLATGTEAPGRAKSAAAGGAEVQQTEPLAAEPVAAEAQTIPQERVEPERIEPAEPADAGEEPSRPAKESGRWWRGFTGSLAAGLTVLAVGVLVVAGIDLYTGAPGPGAVLLIGHPVAAALALVAQRVADRRNGATAAGAGLAVVLFVVSALTLFWLT
ncbi:hypothetical protein ACIRSS_28060 [Amycolatopsis sp. NPDC101161]|uniref:hypothetical protein n=1 Tax=Amycolatopsis sp. NPDC101161 TaxID=3363940 RepID=UPI00381017B3